jgi:hypothetical protein
MFQFPRLPPLALCVQARVRGHDPTWVSPFGHLRISGCVHLPEAFRSLPRPSSALSAKASTVCSWYLDLSTIRCSLSRYAALKVRSAPPVAGTRGGPEPSKLVTVTSRSRPRSQINVWYSRAESASTRSAPAGTVVPSRNSLERR